MNKVKTLLLMAALTLVTIMHTSASQLNRIKSLEGFSAKAYLDPPKNTIGQYSIGYGHQIKADQQSLLTGSISTDTATALLQSDIAPLENQITRTLKLTPTQNQFDALMDFGYNCGSGALSNVITTWNTTKDVKKVTAEIAEYNKVHNSAGQMVVDNDLIARRSEEVALFNSRLSPATQGAIGVLAAVGIGIVILSWASTSQSA